MVKLYDVFDGGGSGGFGGGGGGGGFYGGGGSSGGSSDGSDITKSRLRKKRRLQNKIAKFKSEEEEIAQRMGYPYYGFLLYHSGNKRLTNFLENELTFLDRVSGRNFGIFILTAQHKFHMKIDEKLASGSLDADLKEKIERWRSHTAPFTANKSYEIAGALGIRRKDLPCLILFRSAGSGYRSFALLKMEDKWFPEDDKDAKGLERTTEWLAGLFDALERNMGVKSKKKAIEAAQGEMDALSRRLKYFQPAKDFLVAIGAISFKLPFVLEEIVKEVSISTLKSYFGKGT